MSSHTGERFGSHSRVGFNGQLHEADAAWQILGNGYRAYNPVLMRFHAPDSESPWRSGGLNGYAYGLDDPINRVDPSGHTPWMLLGTRLLSRPQARVAATAQARAATAQTGSVVRSLSSRSSVSSVVGTASKSSARTWASSSSANSQSSAQSRSLKWSPTDSADWRAQLGSEHPQRRAQDWVQKAGADSWDGTAFPSLISVHGTPRRRVHRAAEPADSVAIEVPIGASGIFDAAVGSRRSPSTSRAHLAEPASDSLEAVQTHRRGSALQRRSRVENTLVTQTKDIRRIRDFDR